MDNPYLDPDKADQARVDNFDGAKKKAYEANQKAVVLVKNHEKLLPLAKSQKVCIVTFKGVDSGFAQMAQAMGAGLGNTDEDAALRKTLTEAFEKQFTKLGGTIVAKENYVSKDTDFSSVLTKIKGLDFDVLYIPGLRPFLTA